MKNSREKVETPFFPIITLSFTMETCGRIWPNFKLIQAPMYVIITCKYEKDLIKNSREKVDFSHYKPLFFSRRSRASNSAVSRPIRSKFELVRDLMHVIVACKYEKERMKNSREKWRNCFSIIFTIETSGWLRPNFKLIQALMYVIITCKYEKDPIKNSREKVETSFFPL